MYFDEETELCYNRHRYYDPSTGIYTQKDPISILGGLNVYAYVHDSNTWIDPYGLADFYVFPDGRTIPSKGYRYMSSDASYIEDLKTTKQIPANPNGTYFSFDKYNSSSIASSKLQVPHNAAIRGSFDTL